MAGPSDETLLPSEPAPERPTGEYAAGPPPAAAPPAAARGLPPGSRFGDYELIELIAHGGMGAVYKARQTKPQRVVALKMILAGHLATGEAVLRFQQEAEAAAQLDHPGIVPVFQAGEHQGQFFYSMGFVEGGNLAAQVADGPLPPRRAADLVRRTAEAVAYAHEMGIIHRDLKPSNVLLDK